MGVGTSSKNMKNCQAKHETHDTKLVNTDIGTMCIYDYEKYMGFAGYCPGQDDISRTLDLYGGWSEDIKRLINKILTSGIKANVEVGKGFVIDIGAHIGYFSKIAEWYGYQVLAIDGEDENLRLLKMNVGSNVEMAPVWIDEKISPMSNFGLEYELVKIDIEGNEKYGIRLIENLNVKNIIMEVSPVFNDSYPALIEELKEKYNVFELSGIPFDNNWNFDQKDLWLRSIK